MLLKTVDPEKLEEAAKEILAYADEVKILLFYGEMGAGKTTLIKAICKQLGCTDDASSPTFSIVNEYSSPVGPVFHFDFYRLKDKTEALDIGYEDYIYSGNYCLVEWPERIEGLFPEKYIIISIDIESENTRSISLKHYY